MDLRESLEKPLSDYVDQDFVRASPSESVTQVAKRMLEKGSGEALVFSGESAIGVLTERDILYKVVAGGLEPGSTSVERVMSAPVESIDEGAKVSAAIEKMGSLGVRRLCVMRRGKVVGVVTQKTLVGEGKGKRVLLPELVEASSLVCPYCGATMKEGKELSKHIDQVHSGPGLLEGNKTKW